jgi:endoglucanase Acf2
MKNKLSLYCLGLVFFALLTSMQFPSETWNSPALKVDIIAKNDLKVQFLGQNNTGKKMTLTLSKTESHIFGYYAQTVVYTEQFAGDIAEINRTLDLSKLESGRYEVTLKAGKKHKSQQLDIRNKSEQAVAPDRVISLN